MLFTLTLYTKTLLFSRKYSYIRASSIYTLNVKNSVILSIGGEYMRQKIKINEEELINTIKVNIKIYRDKASLTQTDLANELHLGNNTKSHTSVSNWENTTNNKLSTTLPSLIQFIKLCDILDVDFYHMIGKSSVSSQTNAQIADTLNTKEDTIYEMKHNNSYGPLIDNIVQPNESDGNDQLLNIIGKLITHGILEDVLTVNFTPQLIKDIRSKFDNWMSLCLADEISYESYMNFLSRNLSNIRTMSPSEYINKYFLDEAKSYLECGYKPFTDSTKEEQRTFVIDTIASISYDYLLKENLKFIYVNRAKEILWDRIENYIDQQIEEFHKNAKEYALTHK